MLFFEAQRRTNEIDTLNKSRSTAAGGQQTVDYGSVFMINRCFVSEGFPGHALFEGLPRSTMDSGNSEDKEPIG